METHPSVYSKLTVLTAAKWKISIQEMGLAKQPFFKYRLPDKFHKKIDSGTKCCLFINKMFWLWASDVDLFNTPLPPDFYFFPQGHLIPIDWQTLARSSRQQWHLQHEVSPTSALVELESLPWQRTRTFFEYIYKEALERRKFPSLLSLSLYESFYECFSLKIRNSG